MLKIRHKSNVAMNSYKSIAITYILFLALLLTVTGCAQNLSDNSAGNQVIAAKSIDEAISNNWDIWTNKQTSVTYQTMVKNLASPEYKGTDAAALASVTLYMYHKHLDNRQDIFSRDEIENFSRNNSYLQKKYEYLLQSLATLNRTVFSSGEPDFSLLEQGPVGDCFVFSALGWMAKNRPADLKSMISSTGDGQYIVRFAGGRNVSVEKPTDAELLFFNSRRTLQGGIWSMLIEQAVGKVLQNQTKRVDGISVPAINLSDGGSPVFALRLLTGKEPLVVVLDSGNADLAQLRSALFEMQRKQLLAEALSIDKPKVPKMDGKHIYAILAYDKDSDFITLWNPWCTNFVPVGETGLVNGYAIGEGIFTMPVMDFVQVFKAIVIEHN